LAEVSDFKRERTHNTAAKILASRLRQEGPDRNPCYDVAPWLCRVCHSFSSSPAEQFTLIYKNVLNT